MQLVVNDKHNKKEGENVSEEAIPIKKAISIIVVTWILSLVTTLGVVYFAPNIFPPIPTEKIADNAIITTKLADGSVTSAKIVDGTLTALDLADGSIITVKIADGAVTTVKIADGAITTAKVVDDAIVTIKLADGSVTSAKILDGAITTTDLAAGAIPFVSRYSTETAVTTSSIFEDIPGMSVSITLTRRSHVLILSNAGVAIGPNASSGQPALWIRALVNSTEAFPGYIFTTVDDTTAQIYGYTFYSPNVESGTYTVKIQWHTLQNIPSYTQTIFAYYRTLTVIAMPA
jgi:hypothetical protein